MLKSSGQNKLLRGEMHLLHAGSDHSDQTSTAANMKAFLRGDIMQTKLPKCCQQTGGF